MGGQQATALDLSIEGLESAMATLQAVTEREKRHAARRASKAKAPRVTRAPKETRVLTEADAAPLAPTPRAPTPPATALSAAAPAEEFFIGSSQHVGEHTLVMPQRTPSPGSGRSHTSSGTGSHKSGRSRRSGRSSASGASRRTWFADQKQEQREASMNGGPPLIMSVDDGGTTEDAAENAAAGEARAAAAAATATETPAPENAAVPEQAEAAQAAAPLPTRIDMYHHFGDMKMQVAGTVREKHSGAVDHTVTHNGFFDERLLLEEWPDDPEVEVEFPDGEQYAEGEQAEDGEQEEHGEQNAHDQQRAQDEQGEQVEQYAEPEQAQAEALDDIHVDEGADWADWWDESWS